MNQKNKIILVVEDSDEDFTAFTRIMQELDSPHQITRVEDGDEVLDYLYHEGAYADPKTAPRPAIILMDLNLPGTDGREVIQQVKQDDRLKDIPIVAFTTSSKARDIEDCYNYGVNSYMLKPMGVTLLRETIRELFDYWFKYAVLPSERDQI
ncbi:MAG: response regulator [Hormoscilla sp.]